MDPSTLLGKITARQDLSRAEAYALFQEMMDGGFDPPVLAALLAALAAKGESIAEIVGAAEAMRARVTPVRLPAGCAALDTCSTGGDGKPTFNISTTVAIVVAAAGATVAKHGNRSNRRVSGSAEGLSALGIDVDADVPRLERCLEQCRVAFLYASRLHPAMQHAAPVRRLLRIRTIFNLVGPLSNPAGVRRQFLGVNRLELVDTMVTALRELKAERAMVVHGRDGLCDLSLSAPSRVARWDGRTVQVEDVECTQAGCCPAALEKICVRNPQDSAALIEKVLEGRPGPARDIVVYNSAAALWVAGLAVGWADGAALARRTLESGAARETLRRWRQLAGAAPGRDVPRP